MASQKDRGVPLSTLSPKFLNSNSTSHTWPFSAIAELIDNAYDPDVKAKQLWIDVIEINGEKSLCFMDNGNGLKFDTMHKMLSFGYSEKKTVSGQKPIGIYGNGFKSGSMRLGKDAIVFSKSRSMLCVGMLSQTYLEKIGAKQIRVPIVCFEKRKSNKFFVRDEHKTSLQDILRYSLFKTQEELLVEISAIDSFGSTDTTGTRIIIWNLRRTSTGATEFDFETDRTDIQIPFELYETLNESPQNANRNTSSIPDSVYSLKAYCKILYLKPRMQIMVQGQRVMSVLMAKSLACIRKDHYKPTFLDKRIPITFGYNTRNKDQYGIMMYHKNRLIKAYERVGCQLKANTKGVGVIGVIECDFLEPTHNKQSFTENDKYRKTMNNLGVKLEEYWNEIRYRKSKENPNSTVPVEDTMKQPDQNWVQCDDCLKWRKLPDGINNKRLPDKWYCRINPDPQFRSCLVEEEPEDLDDQLSYCKTYKQHDKEEKKKQEKKLEQDQVHEAQQLSAIVKEFEVLNQQHVNIMQQLCQKPLSTPTAQRGRSQKRAVRVKFSLPSTSSKAACSPSTTSGLPVITSVSSLAVESQRGKRTQLVTSQSTPKRPRINYLQQSTSSTPSAEDESDTYVNNNDHDNDGDQQNSITMLFEGSKKPAVDVTSDEAAASTSTAVKTSCPPQVVNSITQTVVTSESNQGEQNLPNGVAHMKSDETPGPSTLPQFPRIIEVLQQQDQLLELMQDTAQERDSLKQEVQILTIQLQEQSHVSVKKECTHQGCQTEEQKDYKSLFEKAKQKINNLIKDKIIVAAEAKTSLNTDRDEDQDVDEISLQVGCLVHKLDQSENQRDELRSQLDSLEEERSKLAAQCEELRLSLQQQRENAQASKRDGDFSVRPGLEEAGGSSNSDTNTDIFKSLMELRQNVGRLLISYVPALDLEQVNYQCDVIDEILEQVLDGVKIK